MITTVSYKGAYKRFTQLFSGLPSYAALVGMQPSMFSADDVYFGYIHQNGIKLYGFIVRKETEGLSSPIFHLLATEKTTTRGGA